MDFVGQVWVQDVLEHGRSTPAILLYPNINTDTSNITSGKYAMSRQEFLTMLWGGAAYKEKAILMKNVQNTENIKNDYQNK